MTLILMMEFSINFKFSSLLKIVPGSNNFRELNLWGRKKVRGHTQIKIKKMNLKN